MDEEKILNDIGILIELSRYYIYDNEKEYLNYIKTLEKLKNKIIDEGIPSVLRKDDSNGVT